MGQGRPHLQGRSCLVVWSCLARVVCWSQFLPKCVPTYENHNTTRGTLLVLKICMNLPYTPLEHKVYGRIVIVRTISNLVSLTFYSLCSFDIVLLFFFVYLQFREAIYWCLASLRNEED
jgi:hypothetical protein